MATKDWKRYGNLWENAKKNKLLVIRNLSSNIYRTIHKRYDVLIWHHDKIVYESEVFKTKSEALAFVKAYMRKN